LVSKLKPQTLFQDISNPGKLFFKNVTDSVREEARRLYEDEGIRIIMAVGHAGFEVDLLIAELPYIDVRNESLGFKQEI
jgi:2',3'-cyclic-nucleotide 2'-phosphodiesterase (5'-nucleotidase family)